MLVRPTKKDGMNQQKKKICLKMEKPSQKRKKKKIKRTNNMERNIIDKFIYFVEFKGNEKRTIILVIVVVVPTIIVII